MAQYQTADPRWDLEFEFDSGDENFDFRMKGEDAQILHRGRVIIRGVFDAESTKICWRNHLTDSADDVFQDLYHELRKNRYLRYGEV